jgi:hypothetical protein
MMECKRLAELMTCTKCIKLYDGLFLCGGRPSALQSTLRNTYTCICNTNMYVIQARNSFETLGLIKSPSRAYSLGQLQLLINLKIPTSQELSFIGKANYHCEPQILNRANSADLREATSSESDGLQKLVTSDGVLPKTVFNTRAEPT